jgi:hypothetical protein
VYKALFGPVCKAIEKVIFDAPWYAKHINPKDLPAVLRDHVAAGSSDGLVAFLGICEGDDAVFCHRGKYYVTDYTSYESSFTLSFMRAVELPMFKFFMQNLDPELFRLMKAVAWSNNRVRTKYLLWRIAAKRMSGEMWTSLGNGFANAMVISYLTRKYPDRDLTENDFAELGLRCKMIVVNNIGEASFCGQIFDEVEMINVRDPSKVIRNTPWCRQQHIGFGPKKTKSIAPCQGTQPAPPQPGGAGCCCLHGVFAQSNQRSERETRLQALKCLRTGIPVRGTRKW